MNEQIYLDLKLFLSILYVGVKPLFPLIIAELENNVTSSDSGLPLVRCCEDLHALELSSEVFQACWCC